MVGSHVLLLFAAGGGLSFASDPFSCACPSEWTQMSGVVVVLRGVVTRLSRPLLLCRCSYIPPPRRTIVDFLYVLAACSNCAALVSACCISFSLGRTSDPSLLRFDVVSHTITHSHSDLLHRIDGQTFTLQSRTKLCPPMSETPASFLVCFSISRSDPFLSAARPLSALACGHQLRLAEIMGKLSSKRRVNTQDFESERSIFGSFYVVQHESIVRSHLRVFDCLCPARFPSPSQNIFHVFISVFHVSSRTSLGDRFRY
ncbi:uncharacterized protein J3D65DRAFT_283834 [Phyllosticta citribraziliensis]|uniref:Secreted protein n=1 Tax=Phyllosticta citribraziliensis TaxID=989973 RepID=A0ABR1LWK4_9PEZI